MSGFFNPFAKSHLNQKLDTAFSSNENDKKRHYNQQLLKSSMAPSALSYSHHMVETVEKPSDLLPN